MSRSRKTAAQAPTSFCLKMSSTAGTAPFTVCPTRGHSWAPNAMQPDPHWIELDFGHPVSINEVHVTFQLPEMSAKAYDLAIPDGQDGRAVCTVQGNGLRRLVNRFDEVDASRLRLTLKGDLAVGKPVRICEIRVYGK